MRRDIRGNVKRGMVEEEVSCGMGIDGRVRLGRVEK